MAEPGGAVAAALSPEKLLVWDGIQGAAMISRSGLMIAGASFIAMPVVLAKRIPLQFIHCR